MDVDWVRETLTLLLYVLPAMAANGTPVVARRYYGRGHPIDCGLRFIDGRRLLGDGKTWEGFIAGMLASLITGVVIYLALLGLDLEYLYYAVLSGLGALMGDIMGSFVKRRLGIERGGRAPVLDQLDFYAGALVVLWVAGVRYNIVSVLSVGAIILMLHIATNRIAYLLGLKEVPW